MSDPVKSWIEERREFVQGSKLRRWGDKDIRRLTNAIEAVLELHCSASTYQNVSECENEDEDHEDERHTESEDGIPICLDLPDYVACLFCQVDGEPVDWPCPTVRAIEEAINSE